MPRISSARLDREDHEIVLLAQRALAAAYRDALRVGPVQVIKKGKIVQISPDGSRATLAEAPGGLAVRVPQALRGRRVAVRWKKRLHG